MKCLILVGRSSFLDETRNTTSLALYVLTITRMQNESADNMYTVCNFCPCCHDSWCKSCWWWQAEKHLLCFLELTAEQNSERFTTLYFLLSSGITLWFSAWFLKRGMDRVSYQYWSLHECQMLPWPSTQWTGITASQIGSLPSFEE